MYEVAEVPKHLSIAVYKLHNKTVKINGGILVTSSSETQIHMHLAPHTHMLCKNFEISH